MPLRPRGLGRSSREQNHASTPWSQRLQLGPMLPTAMGRPAAIASIVVSDDDPECEACTEAL
jgi:hypothetical protein